MFRFAILLLLIITVPGNADELFGTDPLTEKDDLAAKMLRGIDSYLTKELKQGPSKKPASRARWLRETLGVPRQNLHNRERLLGGFQSPVKIAETDIYDVFAVRWPVVDGVEGEGLLLEPKLRACGQVVAIPDADQLPEDIVGLTKNLPTEMQFARILGEMQVRVIVPALIGNDPNRMSRVSPDRQGDRNFLQRLALPAGATLIGYEVARVIEAAHYLAVKSPLPVGLIGYGEGAVVALYSAALDLAFSTVVCIGYAGPTAEMWREPFSRHVWAIRRELGLAGLWDLIGRIPFCIGYEGPKMLGLIPKNKENPKLRPGELVFEDLFKDEWDEYITKAFLGGVNLDWETINFSRPDGMKKSLMFLIQRLNLPTPLIFPERLSELRVKADQDYSAGRHDQLLKEVMRHLEARGREGEGLRSLQFTKLVHRTRKDYIAAIEPLRKNFYEESIGRLPEAAGEYHAKSRQVIETPKWTAYEVKVDMFGDLFASGILLMPKGIKPREKRPVIVCPHDKGQSPSDVCLRTTASPDPYGARLADLGYIVFAPLGPTTDAGGVAFQMLYRKAHPMKLTLFSFIIRQHERILEWLPLIPQVDANNIGIYGFGYGGKTALRVGAVLTKYKFVVCSGEFTDAVGRAMSIDSPNAPVSDDKIDPFEFNMANTFSHAEMAYLIAPRPFMVERSHDDEDSRDEKVAAEFAKVRYHYAKRLGIGERTEIEYFEGPRGVKGEGTFRFIQKHTGWPIIPEFE